MSTDQDEESTNVDAFAESDVDIFGQLSVPGLVTQTPRRFTHAELEDFDLPAATEEEVRWDQAAGRARDEMAEEPRPDADSGEGGCSDSDASVGVGRRREVDEESASEGSRRSRRSEKSSRSRRSENSRRSGFSERSHRSENSSRSHRSENSSRSHRSGNSSRSRRSENSSRSRRSQSSSRSHHSETSSRPSRPSRPRRPRRSRGSSDSERSDSKRDRRVDEDAEASPPSRPSSPTTRGAPASDRVRPLYDGSSRPADQAGYDLREEEDIKRQLLVDIERLRAKGATLSRLGMGDSRADMEFEIRRVEMEQSERDTVAMMSDGLKLALTGIEFANTRLSLLDLEGWSAQVTSDMERYHGALTRLYKKYYKRGSSRPEMEIVLALFSSMIMFHIRRKFVGGAMRMAGAPTSGSVAETDASAMAGDLDDDSVSSAASDEGPPPF